MKPLPPLGRRLHTRVELRIMLEIQLKVKWKLEDAEDFNAILLMR